MIRALLLACMLLLSACASHAPLPAQIPHIKFPVQLHVQREQAGQRQDWLLVAQKERHGLRFSLMDPLGIPVARQLLHEETWKADGLLPPNPEARELFAAVLFALTSEEEVRFDYPGVVLLHHARTMEDRWRVDYASEGFFRITLEGGELKYIVSPLQGKASK
jgi:hypothetical protein